MKMVLSRLGKKFEWHDIEKDADALVDLVNFQGGCNTLPFLIFDEDLPNELNLLEGQKLDLREIAGGKP